MNNKVTPTLPMRGLDYELNSRQRPVNYFDRMAVELTYDDLALADVCGLQLTINHFTNSCFSSVRKKFKAKVQVKRKTLF